jgi:hypothetical protein
MSYYCYVYDTTRSVPHMEAGPATLEAAERLAERMLRDRPASTHVEIVADGRIVRRVEANRPGAERV